MKYHFRIHRGRLLWAECLELEGCVTQGTNRAVLDKNMREALNLYLEERDSSRIIFPAPSRTVIGRNIVEVEVDPGVAFAMQLRQSRLRSRLTQKEAARKLGLKSIFSYQRLERKGNPSLRTIKKVKSLFPELSLDTMLGDS
jgi:predicted RNase H-like HicB family nuclease/DNA-binding XRE family transcriptional regulator